MKIARVGSQASTKGPADWFTSPAPIHMESLAHGNAAARCRMRSRRARRLTPVAPIIRLGESETRCNGKPVTAEVRYWRPYRVHISHKSRYVGKATGTQLRVICPRMSVREGRLRGPIFTLSVQAARNQSVRGKLGEGS